MGHLRVGPTGRGEPSNAHNDRVSDERVPPQRAATGSPAPLADPADASHPAATVDLPADGSAPVAVPNASRPRLVAEVWIMLGLSLGASAVYSVIDLIAKLTQGPLGRQTATLNPSASPRPYVDLSYQLAGIVFTL